MNYTAPITEQMFVLETIAEIDKLAAPPYAAMDRDLIPTILKEGGRIARGRLQRGDVDLGPRARKPAAANRPLRLWD